MRRVLAALALALPACSGPSSAPAPDRPHAAPLTADEEAVRKWVLDNADDPQSVEFAGWGPDAEVEHLGGGTSRVVRVRYRERNRHGARVLRDRLVYINQQDGRLLAADNAAGDDWKAARRGWGLHEGNNPGPREPEHESRREEQNDQRHPQPNN